MSFSTLVLFFYLKFSFAQDFCLPDTVGLLRDLSADHGIQSCLTVLDEYDYFDTPWCSCFKWPEVVDLMDIDETPGFNCRLTDDDHSDFTFWEARDWCNVAIACTEVPKQSVCESKNCLWEATDSDDLTVGQCTGVNTARENHDELVQDAVKEMEVPWVIDCDMLVAVYKQYHGKHCNDTVNEMENALELHDDDDIIPEEHFFTTTLADVCGETCWFKEDIPACPNCSPTEIFAREPAPFVFERHTCTSHAGCNDDDTNVHDYFCADCDDCKSAFPNAVDECGICVLTEYSETNICIEMQQCTAEKSIDGKCASQTETEVTTGNRQCTASEVLSNTQIDSCFKYFYNLDDDNIIIDNACPCFLDGDFMAIDCAWDLQFLHTLNETKNFCTQPCSNIYDRDACLSAGTPADSENNCVWLNRLVKGQCVDNPCDYEVNQDKCAHDVCLKCQSNALGEPSCAVNSGNIGMSCNDDDSETDRDVCTDTLYSKVPSDATDSVEVDFACRGTNAEQKLEEPKVLCDDTVARKDCCIGGEEYRCLNNVLNYTLFAEGHCNNASIATYYWRMDNSCSNVITTEARSRNIYFSGECDVSGRVAQVTSCAEHDYWEWLASETDNFVPFDDSASTLGMFFISVLLLFWFS